MSTPPVEEREAKLVRVDAGWLGRFRCGSDRRRVTLRVKDERLAYARARKMREVVRALVAAKNLEKRIEVAVDFLEQAADAPNSPAFTGICRAALDVSKGSTESDTGPVTVRDIGDMWLSGVLHQRFPKGVKYQSRETAENTRARIVQHIYPHVGDLAVRNFTQKHFDLVMAKLPEKIVCRDKIARFMLVMLDNAKRLKLISANPIDPDTVPPARDPDAIAFTYLYPDEDAQLVACVDLPLERRLFYGLITRNGFRSSELGDLRWHQVDFVNGQITLDDNKTKRPRVWKADPDVLRALERFKPADAKPNDRIFPWHTRLGLAAQLLRDLKVAGLTRHNLYARTKSRRPLRVHDLRATFVTLAMAAGRSEKWVKDRTGHKTSIMISRYDRRASSAAEAGHDQWLADLDGLLWPDLAPKAAHQAGQKVGQVISIQRRKAASSSSSTTADTLQVHAGTNKSRGKQAPAYPSKRVGPPGGGGAGQDQAEALAGLTTAIANATAACKWALAMRLTVQLEGRRASGELPQTP